MTPMHDSLRISDLACGIDGVVGKPTSIADRLGTKGEGWVLELANDIRTESQYMALGFSPKKITWDLVSELLKDRVLTWAWRGDNLVVNAGLLQTVNLVTGNIPTYESSPPTGWFGYSGVGTGTAAPAAGDTDLAIYLGTRLQVSAAYNINSNEAKWDTYVSPSTWVATWYECGNFTAQATGMGALGSHLLINPTSGYVKGNVSAILDIQWSLST